MGRSSSPLPRGEFLGDGEFAFEVVGESAYQRGLSAIAGGKTRDGVRVYCAALLSPEPSNRHDNNAIKIVVRGQTVGYVARDLTSEIHSALRDARCGEGVAKAVIIGGWRRNRGDEGHFGIFLDISDPPEIIV